MTCACKTRRGGKFGGGPSPGGGGGTPMMPMWRILTCGGHFGRFYENCQKSGGGRRSRWCHWIRITADPPGPSSPSHHRSLNCLRTPPGHLCIAEKSHPINMNDCLVAFAKLSANVGGTLVLQRLLHSIQKDAVFLTHNLSCARELPHSPKEQGFAQKYQT